MKHSLLTGLLLCLVLARPVMAAELTGVTPGQLTSLQKQGAILIDIRTPEEWKKTGLIPGSNHITYFDANGHADKEAWLRQLGALHATPDKPIVLICRSGHRSQDVGNMLAGEKGFQQVYHLEKGLKDWAARGNPVVPCGDC